MSERPRSGLIAIIRGVTPEEAVPIGRALYRGGFRSIEVPLNSPDPFRSIRAIRSDLPADCRVGAGTVVTVADVARAHEAGGSIIVSPNTNVDVVRQTVALGMASYPGAATPTEAFAAVQAGARSIKLFPSTAVGVAGMRAWRSVLPEDVEFLPVGGVELGNLADWARAGAGGAGIGSALYRAGDAPEAVGKRAREFTETWKEAQRA